MVMSEKWYEQSDEDGYIFLDKYLHPECEFIMVHSREGIKDILKGWLKDQNKEEDE
jgi:hypothetical protein